MRLNRAFVKLFCIIDLLVFAPKKIQGKNNLPESGSYIVATNHIANKDVITVPFYLYRKEYPIAFFSKSSLFKYPVLGYLLKKTGQIPVYRGTQKAGESIKIAQQQLEKDFTVGIFTCGTLTKNKDLLPMKAKTGAVRLALESKKPLIPMAHWGEKDVDQLTGISRFKKFFRRRILVAKCAKPLELDYKNKSKEYVQEKTDELSQILLNLTLELKQNSNLKLNEKN